MPHFNSLTACLRPVRIMMLSGVLALTMLVTGCDDDDPPKVDNQWWYSNQISEPEPIVRYGVKWVPASTSGEHTWIFYPEQVLAVIHTSRRLPPGTVVAVSVPPNTWTLWRDADNCKIRAPWESDFNHTWTVGAQADDEVFTDYYLGYIILTVGVCLAVCIGLLSYCQSAITEEQRKREAYEIERSKELDALDATLKAKRKQLEAWEEKAREEATKLDAWQKAEAANLERSRLDTDEYCRRGMEMVRAAQQALKSRPSPRKIGKYLREEHLQGAAFGQFIVVNFLADRNGFIHFKWDILLKLVETPTVVVTRDDKCIRTDAGFAGKLGDHIIPGHRYVYKFLVQDAQNRALGKPLWIEFKTPTKKYWVAESGSDDDQNVQQIRERFKSRFRGVEVVEELRYAQELKIKAHKYPPEIEEWLLSQNDALARELLGGA